MQRKSEMNTFQRIQLSAGIAFGLVFVLLLLSAGQSPLLPLFSTAAAATTQMAHAEGLLDSNVAFVGQNHVDVYRYVPDPSQYDYFRILRDDSEIAQVPAADLTQNRLFYRDSAVSQGSVHAYTVCYRLKGATSEVCVDSAASVTVGQIEGTLYANVEWKDDTYRLVNNVTVLNATLSISAGAVVTPAGTVRPTLSDSSSGKLGIVQVDGAQIGVNLSLLHESSLFENSALLPGNRLDLLGDTTLQGNQIAGSVYVGVSSTTPNYVQFANNRFTGGLLDLAGVSHVTIGANSFENTRVSVRGQVSVTVAGADFVYDSEAAGPTPFKVEGCTAFTLADSTVIARRNVVSNLVALDVTGTCPATFANNVFEGPYPDATGGTALKVESRIPGTAAITVRDSIVHRWSNGLDIGRGDVAVSNNTLTNNWWAVYVTGDAAATLRDNCLAGNRGSALYVQNRTVRLDAERNWWGAPSGPTLAANPGGAGDPINANGPVALSTVDFTPFLTAANCRLDIPTDSSIAGLEVVQIVQNLNNSVPLLAHRPTLVRVYPQSAPVALAGVSAKLRASRNGAPLTPVLSPSAPVTAGAVNWDSARGNLANSLNFVLPDSWLTGTVTLAVELVLPEGFTDLDPANNAMTKTVRFRTSKPVRFYYAPLLPIQLGAGYYLQRMSPSLPAIAAAADFIARTFPFVAGEGALLPPIELPMIARFSISQAPEDEVTVYTLTRLLWGCLPNSLFDQTARAVRVGVLPANSLASGSLPGVSYRDLTDGLYLIHREGQLIAGAALYWKKLTTMVWPYSDPSIQEFGYDFSKGAVVPSDTVDVRFAGRDDVAQWFSPFTYELDITFFQTLPSAGLSVAHTSAGEAAIATEPAFATEADYLSFAGAIADQQVTFLAPWRISAPDPLPGGEATGAYCLDLTNAQGTVLHTRCFDAEPLSYGSSEGQAEFFSALVPIYPDAARAVLRRAGTPIGQLTGSDHPPVLTVAPLQPASALGQISLHWAGSDADGDALTYAVFLDDGLQAGAGSGWYPLIVGTDETSYVLESARLRSSQTARVRIQATDGFHVTTAELGPFVTPDVGPWVHIVEPAHLSTVSFPLRLEGFAYDFDDGALLESGLTWRSNRDGSLGSGSTITLTTLSPGEHTLTLIATDAQGHAQQAQVTVSTQALAPAAVAGLAIHSDGTVAPGALARLAASITAGDHVFYTWDFGDGTQGFGAETAHLYAAPGVYAVTVTAVNGAGQSVASATVRVVAPNDTQRLYLPALQRR